VNSTSDRPRQNKANSRGWDAPGGTTGGAVAQAYCAKQTQFAADGQGRPLPRPEALTMPPTGDKRATTPRCPVSFRQQSQFPATPGGARPKGRGAMGRTRKTKPIPGEGWWDEAQGDVRHGRVRTNPICPSQMGRDVCGGLREPPLFQYSRIPPFQSDAYLQNKAKLGRTGVSGGQDGGDERRANAPNKPNFGHGKEKGKCFSGKELQPIGPAKSTGKTKPIPGRAGSGQGPAQSIVQNEPNSSIADCGSGTDLRRDALCWPLGRRPVVQTNPIGRSQSCKTNPITRSGAPRRCPAGPAGRELGGRGAGAIVQNEANFRSSRRADGTGARHRMAATPPPRRRNLIDSRCRALYYRFPASRGARPARYPVRPRGAKRTTPNA
jgi:hypothetical protein